MSSPVADPLVGRAIDGRYHVVERLADGGMATVYLAIDERLDREVALKLMRPELARDPAFVARFRREAVSAARLSHPNIVTVHDHSEDDGLVFLVMEYVPGATLREVLAAEGPFTPRKALNVLAPVLEALASAHAAGIIHRDVKPENVIIRSDGTVKVADFGLARAVSSQTVTNVSGQIMGTVAYLAPELVVENTATVRSDVYAAGLLLFEMLTGTKPFTGDTAINVAWQHVNRGVPAASTRADHIPPALDGLIARATARDPQQRPADAAAFLALARQVRAGLTPEQLDTRPVPTTWSDATSQPAGPATEALPAVARPEHTPALPRATAAPRRGIPGAPPAEPAAYPSDGSGPPRKRRLLVVLGILLLGLVAAGAFLFGPWARTRVPAVTGQPVATAQQALRTAELDGRLEQVYSETVPAGQVVDADPAVGTEVRKGTTVTLHVSKGQERYAVPNVVGATVDAAKQQVTDAHLTPGAVTEVYDEKVPAGSVVATNPKVGTPSKPGTTIAFSVSKGREPITVPNLVGSDAGKAVTTLTGLGLKVDATAQDFSDTVAKGGVISQTPSSGTLFKGDTVTLVVSKGPRLVTIPQVIGRQSAEAKQMLSSLGFKVKVERLLPGINFGTVQNVDPGEGQQVPYGSTVTLFTV